MERVGHVSADFRQKGVSPTNHCWCQKATVIALLCAIKISAVFLSQCMRVTDGHNYDSQDRASINARAVERKILRREWKTP